MSAWLGAAGTISARAESPAFDERMGIVRRRLCRLRLLLGLLNTVKSDMSELTTGLLSVDPSATQLVAHDVSFDYEGTPVLRNIDLTLSAGDVLGLVGDNGAGKSTFLWILSGRRKPTRGHVTHHGTRVIGSQELEAPFEATGRSLVNEALGPALRRLAELEAAAEAMAENPDSEEAAEHYSHVFSDVTAHDDWNAEHNATIVLDHLGLAGDGPDGPLLDQRTVDMSGGQRARLGLALTLIRKPEILLLDEPTNHLDDRGRQLVIDTIRNHPGIVVVATHDRDVLDEVCTMIGDIVPGRQGILTFRGTYTEYDRHRRHQRAMWEHEYAVQENERARLEEAIDHHRASDGPKRAKRDNEKMAYGMAGNRAESQLAKRIRSAKQRLEELDRDAIAKPPVLLGFDAPLTVAPPARMVRTKRTAALDDDVAFALRGVVVPDRIHVGSLSVRHGDKVVITGPNGAGKSTLLSVITGELAPQAGEVTVAEGLRMAILRQEQHWEHPTTCADELFADAVRHSGGVQFEFADLGLLSAEDARRPVQNLSIGQQRRVALGLIVARPPHILLLDEPTNHLSVDLIEDVQDAIASAVGTVVVVTHDHRMVQQLEARHWVVNDHHIEELPRGQKPVEFA